MWKADRVLAWRSADGPNASVSSHPDASALAAKITAVSVTSQTPAAPKLMGRTFCCCAASSTQLKPAVEKTPRDFPVAPQIGSVSNGHGGMFIDTAKRRSLQEFLRKIVSFDQMPHAEKALIVAYMDADLSLTLTDAIDRYESSQRRTCSHESRSNPA